jgi:hypothetical protein
MSQKLSRSDPFKHTSRIQTDWFGFFFLHDCICDVAEEATGKRALWLKFVIKL